MALVEADPKAFTVKGKFSVESPHRQAWAPPVIANGRLYLREEDSLYCFDIKGE